MKIEVWVAFDPISEVTLGVFMNRKKAEAAYKITVNYYYDNKFIDAAERTRYFEEMRHFVEPHELNKSRN